MQKRAKRDNAGMTLLELIIAASIFAIAAVVFLQAFVTSGRINRKSALYLDASRAAQNLMEEVKGKSFPDLSFAFNYPVNPQTQDLRIGFLQDQKTRYESGILQLKESLLEQGVYKDVRLYRDTDKDTSGVTASVISQDGGRSYTFSPRTRGANAAKYYFQISGMESGEQTFDALLTFDGSESSGYKDPSSLRKKTGKNDYQVPNISELDTKSNAFLIMPLNWDENAMETMVSLQLQEAEKRWSEDSRQEAKPQKLDLADVYAVTKRRLYVRLEESGGTVKASAKYTLNTSAYVKTGGTSYERMDICPCDGRQDGTNGCFCTYESAYTPFYSSETGAELKNLFIFYYPNYNSTSSSRPLDEIVFENTSNYPVQLYVVKQQPEDGALTTVKEQNYRMNLTVWENPAALGHTNWNTNPSLYRSRTVLRTNLDTDISETNDTTLRTTLSQMQLTYQAMDVSGNTGKKVTGKSAGQVISVSGLDDRESEDRIYNVTVGVYPAGAARENFPESERIVLLDGTKDN